MSVEIGVVFRDMKKLPSEEAELRQFLVQSLVPAVMTKLSEASTLSLKAADPVLDQRSVEISIGWKF
jgi:hypothetical protein